YSDDDYHYSDDDLKEIENVDFHTEGDDSVVIKNIATQDPFLTKLCSARILFRGNVEYGVNEETPQIDPDDNQIDHVYKYFKEIIEDPFMPLRKMRYYIRQKFMVDVSVGQYKRAKQLALFDHEGGLIEHYAKLY
nr:splicing factor [Tanacetum cinerariifolium]